MWASLIPTLSTGPGRGPTAAPASRPRPGWSDSRPTAVLLLLLGLCAQKSTQQVQDPVKDFCRRWGHQSAIVDDRLYIDGGVINYNVFDEAGVLRNYTNTYLPYHDLTSVQDDMPPIRVAELAKNASIPSVHGGVLWPDPVNKRLFLFGGEFLGEEGAPSTSAAPSSSGGIYAYDILHDTWDLRYNPASQPASGPVRRVSYGGGVSVADRGEGYYYGGWSSKATDRDWDGGENNKNNDQNPPRAASGDMVKYIMDKDEWARIKGPDNVGRAEGSLLYIPAGDAGMLVYFGGVKDAGGGNATAQPMDQIFVYEVLSQKWYTQNATGDVPHVRSRFCADVATAPDSSSHNIYLYGGADPSGETPGFDDVYVLSLPAFQYIKLHPSRDKNPLNATGEKPHHSLTCNVYRGAQMFVVGGTFPADAEYCDSPPVLGVHMVDLGKKNAEKVYWEEFDPDKQGYQVPDDIYDAIGGDGQGHATKTMPEGGWNAHDLGVLMARTAAVEERRPTRDVTPGGGPLAKGAVIGIAVAAGLALVSVVAAVAFLCLRRRRRRRREELERRKQQLEDETKLQHLQHLQHHQYSPGQPSSYVDPGSGGVASSSLLNSPHTPSTSYGGGGGRNGALSPHSPYGQPPAEMGQSQQPVELPPNEVQRPYHEADDGRTPSLSAATAAAGGFPSPLRPHHRTGGEGGVGDGQGPWVPQVSVVEGPSTGAAPSPYAFGGSPSSSSKAFDGTSAASPPPPPLSSGSTSRMPNVGGAAGPEGHSPVEGWHARTGAVGSGGSRGPPAGPNNTAATSPGYGSWSAGSGAETVVHEPLELMEQERMGRWGHGKSERIHETYYHP